MTWASRELAEEAPEVAPEAAAGGVAAAEEVVRSPEAGALEVSAYLVSSRTGELRVGARHMSF